MDLMTPLPTPPNSNKQKIEHSFSDDGQDAGSSDSPLFRDNALPERPPSPTDALLFPQRSQRVAPVSPPTSTLPRTSSPKRRRLDHEEDQLPSVQSRSPRQVENWLDVRLDLQTSARGDSMARPSKPMDPRPSDQEKELVSTFHNKMVTGFVDWGMEQWFVMRRDPASNTWLQPQNPGPSPQKRMFGPISSNVVQKRKAPSAVAKSVERSHLHPSPKRQIQSSRNPRQRSSATPTNNGKSETRSTRQPANKPVASKDYRDWPDYAPSVENMVGDAAKLARNVPQMSGSKDLTNDPLRRELSDAELIAAQRAGMDCARYLCTKRSVFVGYVKHLRYQAGKYELTAEDTKKGLRSWNKTAAQGCSGIDVNKTSALWQHFWQPIGWFNKDLFTDLIAADDLYFPRFDSNGRVIEQ